MKTLIITLVVISSLLSARSALAHGGHGGHDEPPRVAPAALAEAQVRLRVAEEVARLVDVKKIPESWKEATFRTVERKPTPAGWEWLATLDNPKGKKNEQTLYVFLKPTGEFVAANFSGK